MSGTKHYRVMHNPEPVEILLTTAEANTIAIQRICDISNWKPNWFLSQSFHLSNPVLFVVENVDAHTTHSFTYEKIIREASDEDIMIFNLLRKLKKSGDF